MRDPNDIEASTPPEATSEATQAKRTRDRLLVVRAQLGRPTAVAALVDRWYPEALAYARAVSPSAALAEDACHDAWLDALRGLPKLRDPDAFRAWLFRVLRRRAVDGLRTKARELRKLSALSAARRPLDDAAEVVDFAGIDLRRALSHLRADDRHSVELVHLRGLSYLQAAQVLSVPVGTLRSRVHRARKLLSQSLEPAVGQARVQPPSAPRTGERS